jgi:hypothetical protein
MSLPGRSAGKRGSGTAFAGRFWCDRGHTHLLQFTEMHFPAAPSKRLPPAAVFVRAVSRTRDRKFTQPHPHVMFITEAHCGLG